jgi:hypothetical protein
MHHPVMRAAESERFQLMIGVADKIAIGEEQELDDIPAQIAGARGGGAAWFPRIEVAGRV